MVYRENIANFCKANGLEIYFNSIDQVLLKELDCWEDEIDPSDDVNDLLLWEGTGQGHKFWMVVCYAIKLTEEDKKWFIKTLSEHCPPPTGNIVVFRLES